MDYTWEESAAICFECGELDMENGRGDAYGHFLCGKCWTNLEKEKEDLE